MNGCKYYEINFSTSPSIIIFGERVKERDTIRGLKWKSEIYFNMQAREVSERIERDTIRLTNGNGRYVLMCERVK